MQDTLTRDSKTIKTFYKLLEGNSLRKIKHNKIVVQFLLLIRKPLLHFLVYWVCPLIKFELPFFGNSSYILMTGNSGTRDTNLHVVFKNNFDMFVKSGVPKNKLLINEHPIKRMKEDLISQFYQIKNLKKTKNIVILISDMEFGYRREKLELIKEEVKFNERIEIIRLIATYLTNYIFIIKGHPNIKNLDLYKSHLSDLKQEIIFVPKNESVEQYIYDSNIIIDLPAPNSTAIFFATQVSPKKTVVCIDTLDEFMGDYFQYYEGVTYLNSKDQIILFFNQLADSQLNTISNYSAIENTTKNLDIFEIIQYVRNNCDLNK